MTEATRQFQHYEVLRREDGSLWELGRGAMGITYKAYDVNLCCEVALKVVNRALLDSADARDRFVREARAAAALRHRHVASVYHLGNDGDSFFYAMEFIDGETLDALVRRRGPLPVDAVLRMILQVSKALMAADRQHLVHRDIKPANLMIIHEDADDDATIKVIDFGLARPAAGAEGSAPLTLGGFVGTPQYASPEQLEELPLDTRADIYSLGVTTWYLLTGRPPFSGSLVAVCQQQMSKPPPWHVLPADLPECVRRLLGHMLEKDPAARPQNARELRGEIEECLATIPATASWTDMLGGADEEGDFTSAKLEPRRRSGLAGPPTALAAGRFTGLEFVDEEPGVKIYRARDEKRGKRPVTIQVLSGDWVDAHQPLEALAEEIRLIQAAAHPNLVQLYGWEPPAGVSPALLVEEALVCFSLRELLAARGGTLPPPEALALLEQAAAGVDHAEGRCLEHLDLSLRHLRVHFPFAGGGADGDEPARSLLPLPLADWPEWTLKIHPFATARDDFDPGTWAGDITLLPTPGARASTPRNSPEGAGRPLPRLARLTYELLGGTPPARPLVASRGSRVPALPGLNEEGNAVLRTALAAESTGASCRDFHAALAATLDHRREPGGLLSKPPPTRATAVVPPTPPPRASDSTFAAVGIGSTGTRASSGGSRANNPPRKKLAALDAAKGAESIAELFGGGADFSSVEPEHVGAGSAWERLTLNRGDTVRPGRWLLGLTVTILVFAGAFAGVLALLLHGGPGRTSRGSVDGRSRLPKAIPSFGKPPRPLRTSGVAPRPSAAPVVSDEPAVTKALPTQAHGVSTVPITITDVTPSPTVKESDVAGGTPALVPPATAVPPADPPDQRVTVHVDSNPAGATIWWHDQRLGVTPTDLRLPPGDHDLIARRKGSLETHTYIHLEPGRAPAPEMIRLMDPSFVPSFKGVPSPHAGRATRPASPRANRAAPEAPVFVRPVEAATPPPVEDRTPVLRPLPLEPFEQAPGRVQERTAVRPSPEDPDESED